MSDFWNKLLNGHTRVASSNSLDLHLASDDFGKAVGEDFEGVRALTDKHREANALPLPIAAGTKVSFTGGLGAFLAYDEPPEPGAVGTVVNVRSANGNITHHEGKVFVEWGDGKFRGIHSQHLRRASTSKTAMEHSSEDALKKYLKEHPGADPKNHTVKDSQGKKDDRSAEEIGDNTSGDDVKALGRMDPAEGRKKYDLSKDSMSALNMLLRDARSGDLEDAFSELNGAIQETKRHPSPKEGKKLKKALIKIKDAMERETGVTWDDDEYEFKKRAASDIKVQFEKIKDLAEKRPDSKFLKSLLKQMADKGFAPTDKQMKVVEKIKGEIKQQGEMKKELAGLNKGANFDAGSLGERKEGPHEADPEDAALLSLYKQDEHHAVKHHHQGKKAKVYRVSSLGDLTSFLKRADGKLVHKSTQDLWSFNKDADGNYLVSRLFDDSGEPLKG